MGIFRHKENFKRGKEMEIIGITLFIIAVIVAFLSFGMMAFVTVKDYLEERKH